MKKSKFKPFEVSKHFRVAPNMAVATGFLNGKVVEGKVIGVKSARYNSPHPEDTLLVVAGNDGSTVVREAKYFKAA